VIGLVVPSVANPFWGTFARHLEGAALAEGYHVLLCNSERDPDRERGYIEELWADGIRGVVLCSSLPSLHHVMPLVDKGLSLVAFDRTAAADLLGADHPSTAIVGINDMCALGISAGIRVAGLRVGEDISVVGFDDIVLADLAVPPLTTVRQPLADMAAAAFTHLRESVEGETPGAGRSLLMRPELIVRQSTGPASAPAGDQRNAVARDGQLGG
jgi:DNA-binding LacI/PurR family transcriptional regulator